MYNDEHNRIKLNYIDVILIGYFRANGTRPKRVSILSLILSFYYQFKYLKGHSFGQVNDIHDKRSTTGSYDHVTVVASNRQRKQVVFSQVYNGPCSSNSGHQY